MDLRRAADALGVHYQTAYAWVRQGLLPARKVGRGYQISDDDVMAFAARRSLGQEPIRPIHAATGRSRPGGCMRRWPMGRKPWPAPSGAAGGRGDPDRPV